MKKILGNILIVTVLGLGLAMIAYPASVTQIAGLAVAQTATQWNTLKDFAAGDAVTNGAGLMAPCLFNGLTCDRQRGSIANGALVDVTRLGGATTPSDAFANPTTTNVMWVLNSVFNGTTWDRVRSATQDALASTGLTANGLMGFNGSTWDRIHAVSASNNTSTTLNGALQTTQASTWSVTSTATAGTPSASKALGGGTVRHVATSVTACIAAAATAQPAIQVNLRDGAAGAGTIIRSWALAGPINTGQCVDLAPINMTGTGNTAMTLEFAAATAAGVIGTVTLTGYSTP